MRTGRLCANNFVLIEAHIITGGIGSGGSFIIGFIKIKYQFKKD